MSLSRSILSATKSLFGLNNIRSAINLRRLTTDPTIKTPTSTQTIAEFEASGNKFEDEEPTGVSEDQPVEKHTKESLDNNHPFKIANARNYKNFGWQPTVETHSLLTVDGVPYNKLDTVYVRSTKNNTIVNLVDMNGQTLYSVSAGSVGFKNCKKSTAIAGQAVGLAMSDHIKRRGIKNVRVMVNGFGNGRLPAIKSLQMGNIKIVSITDRTPIPLTFAKPPRPPVPRRV